MVAAISTPNNGLLALLGGIQSQDRPWWPMAPNGGERHPMDELPPTTGNRPSLPPMATGNGSGLLPALLAQTQGTQAPPQMPPVQIPAQAPAQPQAMPDSFDAKGEYDKIWQQMQPPKHKFNFWDLMGIIGPALMAAGGNQEGANAAIAQRASLNMEHTRQQRALALAALKQKQDDYNRRADQQVDLAKPFTVGRDRVQIDPASGDAKTLYHGPQDFEAYAAAQGLQPGTEPYNRSLQDYVLRSSGPSALENSQALDDYRTGNRGSLEALRQANRLKAERARQANRLDLRGTPTYRDTHPLPGRAPRGGGSGEITATGPNGQKIKLVNGQWVPAQ